MADGARRVLGADVGLSITGVAGPDPQDGQDPGTVFVGLGVARRRPPSSVAMRLPGDRDRVRQYATISALDLLRHRLSPPVGGLKTGRATGRTRCPRALRGRVVLVLVAGADGVVVTGIPGVPVRFRCSRARG